MLTGAILHRTDLESARVYHNGLAVAWKGERKGRSVTDLKRQAQTKRSYKVHRTKVQSACAAAWCAKSSKVMLFLTITLPYDVSEDHAAKVWQLFLNSLRQTYKIKHYVWVKEKQQSGRLHYHIVISSGRINIKALQSTFESNFYNVTGLSHITHNSVRLGNNPVLRSIESVSKYLSKYLAKGTDRFERKAYGYSELTLYKDLTVQELLQFCVENSLYSKTLAVNDAYNLFFFPGYLRVMSDKIHLFSSV